MDAGRLTAWYFCVSMMAGYAGSHCGKSGVYARMRVVRLNAPRGCGALGEMDGWILIIGKKAIYEDIKRQGSVMVSTIMEQYGISAMTARRDLNVLEQQDLIERSYGRAVLKKQRADVDAYIRRRQVNLESKRYIAQLALEKLRDAESIYVDSSSTCNTLVDMITPEYSFTVYTNSVPTLNVLMTKPWLKAYIFGGTLSHDAQSLDSTSSLVTAKKIFVDAAILSCSGFDEQKISNNDIVSVNERRVMLSNAGQRVLLADHTKRGTELPVHHLRMGHD